MITIIVNKKKTTTKRKKSNKSIIRDIRIAELLFVLFTQYSSESAKNANTPINYNQAPSDYWTHMRVINTQLVGKFFKGRILFKTPRDTGIMLKYMRKKMGLVEWKEGLPVKMKRVRIKQQRRAGSYRIALSEKVILDSIRIIANYDLSLIPLVFYSQYCQRINLLSGRVFTNEDDLPLHVLFESDFWDLKEPKLEEHLALFHSKEQSERENITKNWDKIKGSVFGEKLLRMELWRIWKASPSLALGILQGRVNIQKKLRESDEKQPQDLLPTILLAYRLVDWVEGRLPLPHTTDFSPIRFENFSLISEPTTIKIEELSNKPHGKERTLEQLYNEVTSKRPKKQGKGENQTRP